MMELPTLVGEREEAALETGLEYREGEPVRVVLRKRGRRLDLRDDRR
jgi:hypothetical protein